MLNRRVINRGRLKKGAIILTSKKFYPIFFCLALLSGVTEAQTPDELLFRSAISVQFDSTKLSNLDKLIASYPHSKFLGEAYGARFSVLLTLHSDSAAFFSLHQYLATRDTQNLPVALQNVAMELGYRKKYPDSALVLLDSSIAIFEKRYRRISPAFFNTRASLLLLLGKFKEAESTQREAIASLQRASKFDPRYSGYYAQLGLIERETQPGLAGLLDYVHACFVSPQPQIEYGDLDSLIMLTVKDSAKVVRVRDSLFECVGNEYFHENGGDSVRAKGFVAACYSRNHVLPSCALQLARTAYDEAQSRSLEGRCDAAFALGVVFFNEENFSEAERYLNEALRTMLPYQTELYLALGTAEEKLGEKTEAFNTYLEGVTVGRPLSLMRPLQALQKELYPHASLDSLIGAAQRKLVDFFPDKYKRPESVEDNPNRKIVLAELFTGSECRPCEAADIAYDKLLERYETSDLTLLEYHLHIPRPDPMANPDAESRSNFYGVSSTPTSVIDGVHIEKSGGQSIAAKTKFAVYADEIDQSLMQRAHAIVKISTHIRRNRISLAVSASVNNPRKSLRLRVVLAEDNIHYVGANGISNHRFVVRKMLRGAGGVAFSRKGRAVVKDAFSVSSVENQLESYLERFEQRAGEVFKEKKSEVDPTRLYIIAFVQDNATHAILQSAIERVKR